MDREVGRRDSVLGSPHQAGWGCRHSQTHLSVMGGRVFRKCPGVLGDYSGLDCAAPPALTVHGNSLPRPRSLTPEKADQRPEMEAAQMQQPPGV